ncbi:nuclear transport factor 2 family protein [Rhodanobacter sp. DHG33]|uniref:YybH family protein n=1 Tax=Rhodanobacter sp. DHG33 TaxID=2775921 RepID=UPI001781659B|nr:nuclear transport factor 2 family protein [Rhodanobacter sp. DHG33]MBD8900185.1 nuclear transport factor 2 family protein [Rhodanobacter sp. DHG33]
MNELTDPFVKMLDAYKAAVLAKDVDAFVALYDDDVHVFDMWGAWSLRGVEPWRNMASGWFSSLGSERVIVEVKDAQSTLAGDLAVGHAFLTYTAVSAEGKELRSLSNRITAALKRTSGAWKVIHEHTSAPVDPESLKAILQYSSGD